MLICKINAQTAKTSLADLVEDAGYSTNDQCSGITIQLDPAVTGETVDVMSIDTTDTLGEGITLTNDDAAQPSSFSFRSGKLSEVYLKASAADTAVRIAVEHSVK